MGSIWELRITITGPTADPQRVKEIIEGLAKQTAVRNVGDSAWEVEYLDFEGRAAALKALDQDLDAIDANWREVLETM
jgi:hypothetical protein